VRLPLAAWALLIGAGAGARALRCVPPPAAARAAGTAAAAWLLELVAAHGSVLAVTHANVRAHVAAALAAGAWRRLPGGGRFAHWSAWRFVPASAAGTATAMSEGAR
jgi:hypothetical protein